MNILQNPEYLWWLLASTLIGGGLAWALNSLFHRSQRLHALKTIESQLVASTVQGEDLRSQLKAVQQDSQDLRQELRLMEVAKVSAETKLVDSQEHFESH